MRAPDAPQALVARDRGQPGLAVAGLRARDQRTERGEERLLDGVLRLVGFAEHPAADALDHRMVAAEERCRVGADGLG